MNPAGKNNPCRIKKQDRDFLLIRMHPPKAPQLTFLPQWCIRRITFSEIATAFSAKLSTKNPVKSL